MVARALVSQTLGKEAHQTKKNENIITTHFRSLELEAVTMNDGSAGLTLMEPILCSES
jgi:hypothetical protein